MLSYALVEFGKPLQAIEREDPTPKGREVLIKVRRSGVCHSDVHIRHGYFDWGEGRQFKMSDRGMALPLALGHEIYGDIVAAGPDAGADEAPIGASRLVFPWIGCENCEDCSDGRENDCQKMQALGILRDGGYATHVLVPDARFLVDIDGLDPTTATPYACSGVTVYTALKKVLPVGEGETLAIIGAGGLGLTAIAIAKAMGVGRVIAVERDTGKFDAARAMGAAEVLTPGEGVAALQAAAGAPLRAVVDTVGAPQTAELSLEAMRKGGRYVVVGLHGGAAKVPIPMMAQKALTMRGSYVGSLQDLKDLIELVRAKGVQSIPVSTRPLAAASETLDDLEAGRIIGRVVLTAD